MNEKPIQLNKMILVKPNDILSFGKLNHGFRCYLAVFGGFRTETVMKSRSMNQNITKQIMLQKNDELKISNSITSNLKHHASIKFEASYIELSDIKVFKGPEFEFLTKSQQNELFSKFLNNSRKFSKRAMSMREDFEKARSELSRYGKK